MENNQKQFSGNLFDMSADKEFIGIGDKNENIKNSILKTAAYMGGGSLLLLFGLGVWAAYGKFLIGLILLAVGGILIYGAFDQIKTRCPECARIGAMEVVLSDSLMVDEDVARYNVFENGRHTRDEVDVSIYTTSQDYEQCCFCGHCRSVIRTTKTNSYTYK